MQSTFHLEMLLLSDFELLGHKHILRCQQKTLNVPGINKSICNDRDVCKIRKITYRYSPEWEAPMTSENRVSHPLGGKSLGWVCLDQSPSNVTSYLASSQAQHFLTTSGCSSKLTSMSGHRVRERRLSCINQISWSCITVTLKSVLAYKNPLFYISCILEVKQNFFEVASFY